MFGMEKQKKKGPMPFLFDLEKELKDFEKQKEYAKRIEERVGRIKDALRKGSKKEDYDCLGYYSTAIMLLQW